MGIYRISIYVHYIHSLCIDLLSHVLSIIWFQYTEINTGSYTLCTEYIVGCASLADSDWLSAGGASVYMS